MEISSTSLHSISLSEYFSIWMCPVLIPKQKNIPIVVVSTLGVSRTISPIPTAFVLLFFWLIEIFLYKIGRARLWWAETATTQPRPTDSVFFTSVREFRRQRRPHSTSILHWQRLHLVALPLVQSLRRIWAVVQPMTTSSNEHAPWMCKLIFIFFFPGIIQFLFAIL